MEFTFYYFFRKTKICDLFIHILQSVTPHWIRNVIFVHILQPAPTLKMWMDAGLIEPDRKLHVLLCLFWISFRVILCLFWIRFDPFSNCIDQYIYNTLLKNIIFTYFNPSKKKAKMQKQLTPTAKQNIGLLVIKKLNILVLI